jgi:hypothetical protein
LRHARLTAPAGELPDEDTVATRSKQEKPDSTMQNQGNARPFTVWVLILLQFLLGLGALAGGAVFLLAPDGSLIQMPLSSLRYTPFSDFAVPGMLLFTFVGIYPVAIAYSLWRRPAWRWPDVLNPFKRMHWSWAGSLAAGVIVIIWIIVEVLLIRGVAFLHILYIAWGGVLILLTLLPDVRRYLARSPG